MRFPNLLRGLVVELESTEVIAEVPVEMMDGA
jgi:molybdopterin-binding protein